MNKEEREELKWMLYAIVDIPMACMKLQEEIVKRIDDYDTAKEMFKQVGHIGISLGKKLPDEKVAEFKKNLDDTFETTWALGLEAKAVKKQILDFIIKPVSYPDFPDKTN